MRLDDIDPTDNAQDLGSGGGGGGGGFPLLGLLPLVLAPRHGLREHCDHRPDRHRLTFAMSGGGGGLLSSGGAGSGVGQSPTAGQSGRQACTGERLRIAAG